MKANGHKSTFPSAVIILLLNLHNGVGFTSLRLNTATRQSGADSQTEHPDLNSAQNTDRSGEGEDQQDGGTESARPLRYTLHLENESLGECMKVDKNRNIIQYNVINKNTAMMQDWSMGIVAYRLNMENRMPVCYIQKVLKNHMYTIIMMRAMDNLTENYGNTFLPETEISEKAMVPSRLLYFRLRQCHHVYLDSFTETKVTIGDMGKTIATFCQGRKSYWLPELIPNDNCQVQTSQTDHIAKYSLGLSRTKRSKHPDGRIFYIGALLVIRKQAKRYGCSYILPNKGNLSNPCWCIYADKMLFH